MLAAHSEAQTDEHGRRNIIVRNCSLRAIEGRVFRIGEVTLRGLPLPDDELDCHSPEETQQTICSGLHTKTLGAQILTEGTIRVGDAIQKLSDTITL